uniref:Uncharacterized protein n=1 Tax=Arundo donax TaxID=35708 RepID=A0A0A9CIX1_ARUDO
MRACLVRSPGYALIIFGLAGASYRR